MTDVGRRVLQTSSLNYVTEIKTQTDMDMFCDNKWPRQSKMPYSPLIDLRAFDSLSKQVLEKVVGISINGILIYTANSINNDDAIFPSRSTSLYLDYDECLGTSYEDSVYHYHMFSPCMIPGVALGGAGV